MLDSRDLLKASLAVAVPIAVEQIRGMTQSELIEMASENNLARVIAEKGDVLQFGGGKRGEAAAAFSSLAKAIAILSFFPGGVSFCGEKFENIPGT